jgi:hypothetical protein
MMMQQQVQKKTKQKDHNKDLLLNVRAKAFELQTFLEDLIYFGKDMEFLEVYSAWKQMADDIYKKTGEIIRVKGA